MFTSLISGFFSSRFFRISTDVLVFFAFLLFLFWGLFDVVYGNWDHDGGYYLLKSKHIADGLVPYRDFQNVYFPLFLYINSFFFKISPSSITASIGIPIFWILINTFLSFQVAKKYTRDNFFSLAIATLYLVFGIDNGNNHFTLEQGIVFFALLIPYWGDRVNPFYIALLVGFATLSKQVGILVLPLALFYSFSFYKEEPKKKIGKVCLSYLGAGVLSIFLLFCMSRFDIGSIKAQLFSDFSKNISAVEGISFKFIIA